MAFVEETKTEREKLVGRTTYMQQGIRDYYETKGKNFFSAIITQNKQKNALLVISLNKRINWFRKVCKRK